jgi:hypothetical protein
MQEKDEVDVIAGEDPAASRRSSEQSYHPPTLTHYGALMDLVQGAPKGGPGPDGGFTPDCALIT